MKDAKHNEKKLHKILAKASLKYPDLASAYDETDDNLNMNSELKDKEGGQDVSPESQNQERLEVVELQTDASDVSGAVKEREIAICEHECQTKEQQEEDKQNALDLIEDENATL